tara:strand:+ start:8095 stop:8703 length:609 start_codon:yes stop_codon:yes gene_type:complete
MVATLELYNLVDRDLDTGYYSVSPRALHQVQKGLANNACCTRADLIMQEVAKRTGDSVIYVIPDGNRGLVLGRTEGSSEMKIVTSKVGMELPLHCGAAPLAILAYSSPDFIDEYLREPLVKCTKSTMTQPKEIRETLVRIREQGFAVGREDLFDHLVSVGVPIFGPRGQLMGSISVGNISQKYPPERINEVGKILIEITASI